MIIIEKLEEEASSTPEIHTDIHSGDLGQALKNKVIEVSK